MPAEPAPGQATGGQRAYEAMTARSAAILRRDVLPAQPWEELTDGFRAIYDDGAAAVAAPLNAEIASLRGQLDRLGIAGTELRGELDDLASWWEHAGQPDGLTRDETWEQEGRRGCARELREALEGGGDGD